LKFNWSVSGSASASAADDGGSASSYCGFNIDYSLNGGSNWINRVSRSRSAVLNDYQSLSDSGSEDILLGVGQNITQVQVRDFMSTSANADGGQFFGSSSGSDITTSISNIRLEVEVVNCIANVPGDRWKGEYFSNTTTLSGSPAMVRDDGTGFLNLNFGSGSPSSVCGVSADNFSARWTRTVSFAADDVYRFTAAVDNGVRLYVDGQLKIDQWGNLPPNTYTADVMLSAVNHEIKMEFVEYTGAASASLSWAALDCLANVPANRWKGEYYNNITLSGPPLMVRDDGASFLNFNFGFGGPGGNCGLGVDNFSARWTRMVNFAPGIYRFSVTGDDGVRLYVDGGQPKIDKWFSQGATTYTADVTLSGAASHQVKLEYFEGGGPGVALLSWTLVSGLSCLPDVLIGNAPRIGGGENIATTAISRQNKACGQKKSD
jgi:hypothetical protein